MAFVSALCRKDAPCSRRRRINQQKREGDLPLRWISWRTTALLQTLLLQQSLLLSPIQVWNTEIDRGLRRSSVSRFVDLATKILRISGMNWDRKKFVPCHRSPAVKIRMDFCTSRDVINRICHAYQIHLNQIPARYLRNIILRRSQRNFVK